MPDPPTKDSANRATISVALVQARPAARSTDREGSRALRGGPGAEVTDAGGPAVGGPAGGSQSRWVKRLRELRLSERGRPDVRAGGVAGSRTELPTRLLAAASILRDRPGSDASDAGVSSMRLFDSVPGAANPRSIDELPSEGTDHLMQVVSMRPSMVVLCAGMDTGAASGRTESSEDRTARLDALIESGTAIARLTPSGPAPLRVALSSEHVEDANQLLERGAADVVLRGESDELVAKIRDGLALGDRSWEGARGTSWTDANGERQHGGAPHPPLQFAPPAWDMIDLGEYSPARSERWYQRLPVPLAGASRTKRTVATIVTSRACSPTCPTCRGSFGAARRDRDAEDVVDEIRDLVTRRGAQTIAINDHAFDARPDRALRIARAIAAFRRGPGMGSVKVTFPMGFRGDGLTPALIDALIAAGLERFDLQVVTASPRLQRLLKENILLDRVLANLEAIANRGAQGHLMLRLGLPTETAGEAAHTIRWARESHAQSARFTSGRGLNLGPSWKHDETDEMDDFVNLRRRAYRSFYSSPRRAGRWARDVPRSLLRLVP